VERADPQERRETQPEGPPPAEALPGEAEDAELPGEVTAEESLPTP
jgi:hypothetical protein